MNKLERWRKLLDEERWGELIFELIDNEGADTLFALAEAAQVVDEILESYSHVSGWHVTTEMGDKLNQVSKILKPLLEE